MAAKRYDVRMVFTPSAGSRTVTWQFPRWNGNEAASGCVLRGQGPLDRRLTLSRSSVFSAIVSRQPRASMARRLGPEGDGLWAALG